jgi:hypothetical protein
MRRSSMFASFIVIACGVVLVTGLTPGVLAGGMQSNSPSIAAAKTYKRKCTSSKCGVISEKTQPIFKCPICGSSTVPVK